MGEYDGTIFEPLNRDGNDHLCSRRSCSHSHPPSSKPAAAGHATTGERVQRRTSDFEQFATLVANVTPIPETFVFPTAVPSPGTYTFGTLIGDLPAGQPADATIVAGITDTMQQIIACDRAGDPYRLYALF